MRRLAAAHPDKKIRFLDSTVCFCSTMNRIDLPHLVWAMESLVAGRLVNRIVVDADDRPLGARGARPDARPAGVLSVSTGHHLRVGIFVFDDARGARRRRAVRGARVLVERTRSCAARGGDVLGATASGCACAKGLRLVPDLSADEVGPLHVLVYPGGSAPGRSLRDADHLEWVRGMRAATPLMTSVCTGALVYAAAGLLAGRPATTHWSAFDELATIDPTSLADTEARFVDDGDIVTSAGVSAGIDMALHLVARLESVDAARAVRRGIQYDPSPPYDRAARRGRHRARPPARPPRPGGGHRAGARRGRPAAWRAIPGFRRDPRLPPVSERTGTYLLLLGWDSVEAPEVGLPRVAAGRALAGAAAPLLEPFPVVEHFVAVPRSHRRVTSRRVTRDDPAAHWPPPAPGPPSPVAGSSSRRVTRMRVHVRATSGFYRHVNNGVT